MPFLPDFQRLLQGFHLCISNSRVLTIIVRDKQIQSTLDLVSLLVHKKTDPKSHDVTKVLYICVGFGPLAHLTRDLSQAQKKMNIDAS